MIGAALAASAALWALGDGADGSAEARAMARRIERDEPDAVLYLGDVYPSGTAEDYRRNWQPVYGRLASDHLAHRRQPRVGQPPAPATTPTGAATAARGPGIASSSRAGS